MLDERIPVNAYVARYAQFTANKGHQSLLLPEHACNERLECQQADFNSQVQSKENEIIAQSLVVSNFPVHDDSCIVG